MAQLILGLASFLFTNIEIYRRLICPNNLWSFLTHSQDSGRSTADGQGKVNSAYFGSPQMSDEKTIVMGIGK